MIPPWITFPSEMNVPCSLWNVISKPHFTELGFHLVDPPRLHMWFVRLQRSFKPRWGAVRLGLRGMLMNLTWGGSTKPMPYAIFGGLLLREEWRCYMLDDRWSQTWINTLRSLMVPRYTLGGKGEKVRETGMFHKGELFLKHSLGRLACWQGVGYSDSFGSSVYEAVMLDLKNARSLTQALGFWQRTLLQLRFDLNFIELCPCVCVCVCCVSCLHIIITYMWEGRQCHKVSGFWPVASCSL